MLSPAEALSLVLERIPVPEVVEAVPLARAAGRCLARTAVSDVDLPPFEKSMMDGFAVRSGDFAGVEGEHTLACVGESRAGVPFAGRGPSRHLCRDLHGGRAPGRL